VARPKDESTFPKHLGPRVSAACRLWIVFEHRKHIQRGEYRRKARNHRCYPKVKTTPQQPEKHDPAQEAEDKLNAEIKANNSESQPYAGLGATKAAFKAHNNVTEHEPPAEPAEGTDEDAIETTNSEDRVTKYERIFHFNPPPSNRERLDLVAGIGLPGYPAVVRETSTCEVWRSPILKRLVGDEYAQATTADESTSVTMEAVSHPSC
jgi:hypothetical protein